MLKRMENAIRLVASDKATVIHHMRKIFEQSNESKTKMHFIRFLDDPARPRWHDVAMRCNSWNKVIFRNRWNTRAFTWLSHFIFCIINFSFHCFETINKFSLLEFDAHNHNICIHFGIVVVVQSTKCNVFDLVLVAFDIRYHHTRSKYDEMFSKNCCVRRHVILVLWHHSISSRSFLSVSLGKKILPPR